MHITTIVYTRDSSQRRTKPLATVVLVTKNFGSSRKLYNQHFHNTTVHFVANSEEQADVSFIMREVREQMGDNSLALVGVNGLMLEDQERNTGNKQK